MIPKIIHYCWFGNGEKPEIVKKCIDSWREKCIGYAIIEWNERNFDINSNKFVREAYAKKKYAFVSDYVRLFVLKNFGGIYLDTDVEVLKNFDEYLNNKSFWGLEAGNYIATSTIGTEINNPLIEAFYKEYLDRSFINEDGTLNVGTNVEIISKKFKELGAKLDGSKEIIEGIGVIYPTEIFSPYDYRYYKDYRTDKTVTVHYFYKSWISKKDKIKQFLKKGFIKIFGVSFVKKVGEKIE